MKDYSIDEITTKKHKSEKILNLSMPIEYFFYYLL